MCGLSLLCPLLGPTDDDDDDDGELQGGVDDDDDSGDRDVFNIDSEGGYNRLLILLIICCLFYFKTMMRTMMSMRIMTSLTVFMTWNIPILDEPSSSPTVAVASTRQWMVSP